MNYTLYNLKYQNLRCSPILAMPIRALSLGGACREMRNFENADTKHISQDGNPTTVYQLPAACKERPPNLVSSPSIPADHDHPC
jgi:hypothetical protein